MDEGNRTMDQKIFSAGLSVEAISLYLLCCGLADGGETVSSKNITSTWNSSPEALIQAYEDLENANVLKKILSDREGIDIYRVMDSHKWK